MEKISRIVGGTQRVAAVDLKNSAPVRPGTPTFGRPVGISTRVEHDPTTTAQKAVELMNQRDERRIVNGKDSQIVQNMADNFFMSRNQPIEPAPEVETEIEVQPTEDEKAQAQFTPRGSYVDVQA